MPQPVVLTPRLAAVLVVTTACLTSAVGLTFGAGLGFLRAPAVAPAPGEPPTEARAAEAVRVPAPAPAPQIIFVPITPTRPAAPAPAPAASTPPPAPEDEAVVALRVHRPAHPEARGHEARERAEHPPEGHADGEDKDDDD